MAILMLAVALAQIGVPPPVVPPPPPIAPRSADPQQWVTSADYPIEELRNGAEGVTAIQVMFGADGMPSRCTVTQSSGNSALDRAACAATAHHARLPPGAPARVVAQRVAWRIPPPAALTGRETTHRGVGTVTIDADGTVLACSVDAPTMPAMKAQFCNNYAVGRRQPHPFFLDGRPRRVTLTRKFEETVIVQEGDDPVRAP